MDFALLVSVCALLDSKDALAKTQSLEAGLWIALRVVQDMESAWLMVPVLATLATLEMIARSQLSDLLLSLKLEMPCNQSPTHILINTSTP